MVFKPFLTDLLKIVCVSVGLFLAIDFFSGQWVLSSIRKSDYFRTQHPVFHHTLKPNFEGLGRWGDWTYKICTNSHGFKDRCPAKTTSDKSFDVAFMGDSFTEGIGLPFDQTFVGMVSNSFPNLRIANLGVVSYSPAIYLSKLKELYKQGYRFKHVIVFIDIADVYDEANAYDLHHDGVVVDKGEVYPLTGLPRARRVASKNFPLTAELWGHLKKLLHGQQPQPSAPTIVSTTAALISEPTLNSATQVSTSVPTGTTPAPLLSQGEKPPEQAEAPFLQNIYDGIYLKGYPKSEWTYNTHSRHYGPTGVIGNLEKMQRDMKALHTLVSEHGATLSVGVYPWPGQILYDVTDSLHVQIWRDFCSSRCLHFYNAFPAFFELSERLGKHAVVNQYYFPGDAHFNTLGNKIIAETILRQGIQ